MEEFRRRSKVLFDISSCKCKDFSKCDCPKDKKIPVNEQSFISDQRTTRKMIIGNVDTATTKRMKTALKRKLLKQKSLRTSKKESTGKPTTSLIDISTSSASNESDCNDVFKPNVVSQMPQKQAAVTIDYSTLSKTCDRYGVSDRAAAAIASAVLYDIKSNIPVIDKSKLRRERKKTRENIKAQHIVLQIPALYFDGRKDKTLIIREKGGRHYRELIIEEHISMIKEPDSIYLGYIAPNSGTSKVIERTIVDYFLKEEIPFEPLMAIGCDGTNVNVGKHGGIIRLLEKRLDKPLQWIICLLHMNELPFRHLFTHLDGKTSGPQTYSGTIGLALENCEKKPIVHFQKIDGELPELLTKDLSTDQLYLYKIVSAVTVGELPEDLGHKSPGKMSHARWLTRANRILRLYVATEAPTENLIILATYVVKVYAPTWFSIKTHPTCKDGARHLWQLISASRYLSPELKTIIDPVIERNSYFAHPENLLLAMLTDPHKHIRELAARRVLKARSKKLSKTRLFQLPNINLDASYYYDLINWQQNVTEPPILKNISDEDLQLFVAQGGEGKLPLLRLPCHTQAVERAVKTVTEASTTLCTKSAREGLIKAKIESRKIMPKFESKKDFAGI